MTFSLDNVGDQTGRIALVTGANVGLGYEVALAMAKKGMKVVLACRNADRAELAKQKILEIVPNANLGTLQIDLSKLSSVRSAAEAFRHQYKCLNVLVNNAGIMFPPYSITEDGFESQMATNSFGHFLLTSLLINLIPDAHASRIVWVSSAAHKTAKIAFNDINFAKKYSKGAAYGQSKLACLMYALELNRRLKAAGSSIISNSAHPGGANTDLSRHMSPLLLSLMKYTLLPLITHSVEDGAAPILEAALSPTAEGGQYYGPQGFLEMSGPSGIATIGKHALDTNVSQELWRASEQLTGAAFSI